MEIIPERGEIEGQPADPDTDNRNGQPTVAVSDQIRAVAKERLRSRLGVVTEEELVVLEDASGKSCNSDESARYWLRCLNQTVSGQSTMRSDGETIEKANANGREALRESVAVLKRPGRLLPFMQDRSIGVRMDLSPKLRQTVKTHFSVGHRQFGRGHSCLSPPVLEALSGTTSKNRR